MKRILWQLALILLPLINNAQLAVWNFDNTPAFGLNVPNFTLQVGQQNPCTVDNRYWIANNMNAGCNLFPNRTGTGRFLTINSDNVTRPRITTNLNLAPGVYLLSMDVTHRSATNGTFPGVVTINNIATNNAPYNALATRLDNGNVISLTNQFTVPNNTNWSNIQMQFVVTQAGTFGLVFDQDNSVANWADFSFDNLSIFNVCAPVPQGNFFTRDASGLPKTNFCYGEDIFIDGNASQHELGYSIFIQSRPIGANPWDPYTNGVVYHPAPGSGWVHGNLGVLNLSQLMNNPIDNFKFAPGYDYKIVVSLYNHCIAWIPFERYFRVECCTNGINPAFQLSSIPLGSMYQIQATNFNPYPNIQIQNEWILYSCTNPNGPYQYISTTISNNFSYTGSNNLCYLVIRRITTQCGTVCYGQMICNNPGFAAGMSAMNCPFCGPIPGCNLPPTCGTPTGLTCFNHVSGRRLQWSAVPGAIEYRIERIFNDPDCCITSNPPINLPLVTITGGLTPNSVPPNFWNLPPDDVGSCFSWRVTAVCLINGQISLGQPSVKACYNMGAGCMNPRMAGEISSVESGIELSGNPVTNGQLKLRIQGIEPESKARLELYTMEGRRTLVSDMEGSEQYSIDVSNLSTGIYILKVLRKDHETYTQRVDIRN